MQLQELMEHIDISLYPIQNDLLQQYIHNKSHISIIGERGGKTFMCAIYAVYNLLNGISTVIVLPTRMHEEEIYDYITTILKRGKFSLTKMNRRYRTLVRDTSFIQFKNARTSLYAGYSNNTVFVIDDFNYCLSILKGDNQTKFINSIHANKYIIMSKYDESVEDFIATSPFNISRYDTWEINPNITEMQVDYLTNKTMSKQRFKGVKYENDVENF